VSTRILHIEPITDPDDGSQYDILDEDGNELAAVYGGKELALKMAAAEPLLEAAIESRKLGSKIYHNANAHEAPLDWAAVKKLLDAAIDAAEGRTHG
jgi:hypothetical protein